jgi:hypothetical protein
MGGGESTAHVRGKQDIDVDGRTGLVVGGLTAVAASVAVVTAVALTNATALQDSPGSTVTAGRVLVPAASPATTTPLAPAPAAAPQPHATAPPAEIAEAPAPVVVDTPPTMTRPPVAPATAPDAAPQAPVQDLDTVIAAAEAAGSWDEVRAWAHAQGWSSGRIEALVARLDRDKAAEKAEAPAGPAQLESGTDQDLVGTELQRSAPAPQPIAKQNNGNGQKSTGAGRPADAGSNGNGNGVGPHEKKDQSRDSPDRRD